MGGDDSKRAGSYWALFRSEPRFLSFAIAMTFFSGFGQTFFVSALFPKPHLSSRRDVKSTAGPGRQLRLD